MRDGIMLTVDEDGTARVYDDTYDIVIHCESQEEHDKAVEMLRGIKPNNDNRPTDDPIDTDSSRYGTDRTTDELISRQAVLDAISEEPLVWCDDDDYALGMHNQWIADRAAIKAVPSVQPRWIPCSEQMPDEDYWTGAGAQHSAEVLMTVYSVADERAIIDFGHTVDGKWYSDRTDCYVPSWWKVLAWKPLPKPWEGDKK